MNLTAHPSFSIHDTFDPFIATPAIENTTACTCTCSYPQHIPPYVANELKDEWLLFLTNLQVEEWWKIGLSLACQSHFSEENLQLIFKHEAQVRQAIEHAQQVPHFQIHSSIVNLHQKVLEPLVNQAKSFLINRTAHTAITAAKQKGTALQTGIQGIKWATQMNRNPFPELSSQEVYLLPPFSVIKKCCNRADEEESLMEGLFSFQIKEALLLSANIESPLLKRWGIPVATDRDRARGYYYSELEQDPILKNFIFKRLPPHSQNLYNAWIANNQPKPDNFGDIRTRIWTYRLNQLEKNLTLYQLWEKHQANLLSMNAFIQPFNQTVASLLSSHLPFRNALLSSQPPVNQNFKFTYQQSDECIKLSFKELQGRYLRGWLHPEATIQELNQTIQDLILSDSDFGKALTQTRPSIHEPLLIPVFPNVNIQQAFRDYEKQQWTYRMNGTSYWSTFRELFRRSLTGTISNVKTFPQRIVHHEIEQVLSQTKWKLVMPELYFYRKIEHKKKIDYLLKPARSLHVKPFLKSMILLDDLINNRPLFDAIQKKLTESSQYKAFLTGLFQCLDLYSKNIGVAPCSSPQVNAFQNTTFIIYDYSACDRHEGKSPDRKQCSLDELRKDYLLERILPDTWITYYDDKEDLISAQLQHLEPLFQALNGQWEWVFFDFDLCLGESNTFQKIKRNGLYKTLIPFRSAFLSLDYKHDPLNAFTLAQFENSEERDAQMNAWIKRLDAPIRKRLSQNTQKQVDDILTILLQRSDYSISQAREKDNEGCLKTIQACFAVDLADSQDHHHQKIWQLLEQDLSHVPIYNNDTYESLAKRHKQNAENLRLLNQNQELIPGCQAKISYSLIEKEDRKKRIDIAYQLFPRLTWKQQKALTDRQLAIKKYLTEFFELQKFVGTPQETLELLKQFIDSPIYAKAETYELIHVIQTNYHEFLQNPDRLQKLRSRIERKCQPTLFNLMAVMYPHLVDNYALAIAKIGPNQKANKPGNFVGDYHYPLENLIQEVKSGYSPNNAFYLIAQHLDQAIENEKDPYLFFVF